VKALFISKENLDEVLNYLSKRSTLYTPRNVADRWAYRKYSPEAAFEFNNVCAVQPAKSFLFVPKEKVAEYPSDDPDRTIKAEPITVVGMKACDIRGILCLDAEFLEGDYPDPFYEERRKNCTIITTECYNPLDTCFCNMLDIEPFADESAAKAGVALNISPAEGGYLVDVVSTKGEEIVGENKALFSEPSSEMIEKRERDRGQLKAQLEEINKQYKTSRGRQQLCKENLMSDKWEAAVEPCVECAACLFVCPTCHCFLLYDQKAGDKNVRIKVWDGCIYSGYGRMAGGGNPRPRHLERFRHRFLHKFDFFVDNFNLEACTGCGRCIRGCSGNIDVRKVFKLMDVEEVIPVNR